MNLTEQQLVSFKEKYANVIVNNMTLKECQELIFNQICNDFDNMSFDEIVEESVNEDKTIIEQLVKEVITEAIKIFEGYNRFDGRSIEYALNRGVWFLKDNFDLESK